VRKVTEIQAEPSASVAMTRLRRERMMVMAIMAVVLLKERRAGPD
jgi:hypothetical protein